MEKVRIPGDFHFNPDPIVRSMFTQDLYDWWGRMLNLEEVHKHATGKGVNIAILDTGFFANHPDLLDNGLVADFTSDNDPRDSAGHGSHVRGLIGMQPNGKGYVGAAPGATLHIGKVLDMNGIGTIKWLEEALVWCLDNEFDWVTGSLSMGASNDRIVKRINQLKEKGIGCTFAAGNDFKNKVSFPASLEHCIAVGAHDYSKLPADFSNIGPTLDLLAPGVNVNSTWIDGDYRSASGSCIRGDQWVSLEYGYKKIKDIVKGDRVWTLNEKTRALELKSVRAKIYSGSRPVFKVTTGGETIYCTSNHPFLKHNIINLGTGPLDMLRNYERYLSWEELKDLREGDTVLMSKAISHEDVGLIKVLRDKLGEFNEDTAYTMGYWLGDGWYTWNSIHLYAKREFWSELYCKIERGFPKNIIKSSYRRSRNEYNIRVLSVGDKLRDLGFISGAKNKIVPNWVFSLQKNFKEAFLAGYFDSDGSMTEGKGWRNADIYSSSFKLVKGIKKLLDSLNIRSANIYERPPSQSEIKGRKIIGGPAYKTSTYQFSRLQGVGEHLLDQRYKDLLENHGSADLLQDSVGRIEFDGRKVRPMKLEKDIYLSKITKIQADGIKDVWDIEVEGNHNFICENFVVHNSMATPLVAGICALIIELERNLGS